MRVIHNHYACGDTTSMAMNLFLWGVFVVAAVCLLQLPATHFLSRYVEQDRSGEPNVDLPANAEDYPREPGVCPRCRRQNDPTFAHCAHCLAPLRLAGESSS